jgi:flagellar hook-associated protein 1 FlgK
MSTFGSLNTAFTGLSAARAALNTAGQNIANANTEGYTRQRVTTSAAGAPAIVGLAAATRPAVGQGVNVDAIARLGNAFADSRVRTAAAQAGYSGARAEALSAIEANLQEPGAHGISSQLHTFWANWGDVANQPDSEAVASVLLENASVLTGKITAGYAALDSQWTTTRGTVDTMAAELNASASQVAALNGQIRSTQAAGGSANELIDQRAKLATSIAFLAGGTVRDNSDGTLDVVVGGNAIVSGTSYRPVTVTGASRLDNAAGSSVQLEWADRPGQAVAMDSGRLAGTLTVLAPASGVSGGAPGGAIAEAAKAYDDFAATLAAAVNTVHQAGSTRAGGPGGTGDFFTFRPGTHPALTLAVEPTNSAELASGARGAGAYDGSNADLISQVGTGNASPDKAWSAFVTTTAVAVKSELLHSSLADAASTAAVQAQISGAGVDFDEENVNILAAQHAYQAAARVMSAIDEALNTLINRTGLVGR